MSRAAYALPPLLPPVRVGGSLHADGGLLYNAPLEHAAGLGASEIVYVCNVQVLPHLGYERPHTLPSTLRYLDVFFRRASNLGFADEAISEGLWRDIPFLAIAPPPAPGLRSIVSALRPTRAQMQRLAGLGYNEALGAFAQWRFASPTGLYQLPARRGAAPRGPSDAVRQATSPQGLRNRKDTTMKATALLRAQHAEARKLFAAIESGKGDAKAAAEEVARKLLAHMIIEQTHFYPAVLGLDEDAVQEGYEEHAVARYEIRRMLEGLDDPRFESRATTLKELIEHHVKEEEEELFPKVDRRLPEARHDELGAAMEALFESLMELEMDVLLRRSRRTGEEGSKSAA